MEKSLKLKYCGEEYLLPIKKFMIILMALLILFTVTNEFVSAKSENTNSNTKLSNNISLEVVDNITYGSNELQSQVNDWVQPIIQIQYDANEGISKSTNNSNTPNNIDHKNNSSTYHAGLNEQKVQSEFNKIRNIPYNEKSMNCEVKSKLFASYLYDNSGKQINLVVIEHDSGNYSHEFVEWNGHYYDACNNNELSYTLSERDYLQQLHQLGFTGLTITSPYPN
jgi:hypothetical protein